MSNQALKVNQNGYGRQKADFDIGAIYKLGGMILKIHPSIQKTALLDTLVGILLTLTSTFALTSMPGDGSVLVVAFLLLALLSGLCVAISSPRWYFRATWVLNNIQPRKSKIILRRGDSADSRSLYAEINSEDLNTSLTQKPVIPVCRIRVIQTDQEIIQFIDTPISVEIYCDPNPRGPVVISTNYGLLWPVTYATLG